MSEMYENVKKGLEEAIGDAKGEIKLERHTVENNAPKISKKINNKSKK